MTLGLQDADPIYARLVTVLDSIDAEAGQAFLARLALLLAIETDDAERVFKAIDAPRSLVFTWGWEGAPSRESLVTITLRETGGRTELTLRQEGLGSASNRDNHSKGWNGSLDKLGTYLRRPA